VTKSIWLIKKTCSTYPKRLPSRKRRRWWGAAANPRSPGKQDFVNIEMMVRKQGSDI